MENSGELCHLETVAGDRQRITTRPSRICSALGRDISELNGTAHAGTPRYREGRLEHGTDVQR
ncbi:hypothetical protein [Vacuolonema iberomarrocanum]|uniref:hypothetical protein n=1 Tax=Vacuolonema iberomarrocanum TaxID=3454632 RepID=UPI001A0C010D|nr:hypothetical protein [filamentous cyanobacterium LEGE 07170]